MTTPGTQAQVALGDDIRTLEDLCLGNTEFVLYMKSIPNKECVILLFYIMSGVIV